VTIELPDTEIANLRLTPEKARVEVAVGLYAGRQVTMGRAAKIAGISYGEADALQDVETARQRSGK
jgi:predicted HTH domain antitoxin